MKQFLCELLFTCTLLAPGAKPVDELTYGTVLYEYFQEENQEALLRTLVAKEQGRQGEDWIRFDLAAGSFAFGDGMYAYANETFAGIPEGELSELDSMRLAFHLSREYHRRQNWTDLEAQLTKIELGKTWLGRQKRHPEVEFMRAELAIQKTDFATAERHLADMEVEDPLRAYGLFNLGIAYREADDLDGAQNAFSQLAQLPAYSEEAYDLGQRAKLALAFLARQARDRHNAGSMLAELPGEGRYQDVAMAAYGGLAMDNEDYELAARIWMTLGQNEYWTSSTATARLGFPMSIEKMAGASAQATTEMALVQYRQAEASFASRLEHLVDLSAQAQDPAWVHGLLEVFAAKDADPDKMQELMSRWQDQLGHTDWLEWLATDKVNQALVQWRELNDMQSYLGLLPEELGALQGVATEQQRRADEANSLLVDDGLLSKRQLLGQELVDLELRLAAVRDATPVRNAEWMVPLASSEERELLQELAQMRKLIHHMQEHDEVKWRARIDRLEGVVFFRLVEERSKRLQVLQETSKELAAVLAELDERIVRVEGAEENFVASVGTDFLAFLDRADGIIAKVDQARSTRETLLAGEIRGRMQQEMQQVQQYLLVTRIAIARATDQIAMRDTAVQEIN